METTLFKQYVDTYFAPLILKIVNLINGTENPIVYYHKRMLRRAYSPTMKWGSLGSNGRTVAADVVSLNSPLPLKRRDSAKKAEGEIPKLGMKLYLDEQTLQELDQLEDSNQVRGGLTDQITKIIFADTRKCIVGIDEQLEGMYLQALSSGMTIIADENNTGTGIRLDFQIPDGNKFGVTEKWSGETANPLDHIENMIAKARANGHTIRKLMMERPTFNNMRKHQQVKDLFAAGLGFAGANIPTPNQDQTQAILQSNYGVTIEIVDRTVNYERSTGEIVTVNPWAPNVIVGLTSDQVGRVVWTRLAEMTHRAKQVTYAIADEFKLISKYHKIDPLEEYTSSQAIAVPVLDAVDEIYLMDTEEATASLDVQTEGDAVYTYKGTDYTKQSVVDGLNATEEVPVSDVTQADSTLAKKIDRLTEEGVATFETHLVASGV